MTAAAADAAVGRIGPGPGADPGPDPGRRHGTAAVYRVELRKLAAQARVRVAAGLALAGPFLFAGGLSLQDSVPADTLFGRWSLSSGFALPLLVLGFAGAWVFPLLACLVAGDIAAAEDAHGTWPVLLTRSVSRGQVLAGKALAAMTYTVTVLAVAALSSLAAGVLVIGRQPLVGLSGTEIPPGRAAVLVLASWAACLPPAIGFTALGLFFSGLSRRAAVGIGAPVVLGLLMQLASLVGGLAGVRFLLLGSAFDGWHAIVTDRPYTGPLVQGVLVSVAYTVLALAAARELLLRRDPGTR